MATFKFRAISMHTQEQLPVEVFLAGKSLGFAPTDKGEYLQAEAIGIKEPVVWYAMIWNIRIAKGESLGGTFDIHVDEKLHQAELEATP